MAYTEYIDYTSGLELYAKAKPLDTGTWSNGIVALTENGTTGEYSSASFVDDTTYNVFIQDDVSPASTDTKTGFTITPPPGGSGALTNEQAAKIALIGTGAAIVNSPVADDGTLEELIIGDDYLSANGRALEWVFDEIAGITASGTAKFGLQDAITGEETYTNTTGAIEDLLDGTFKAIIEIPNTALTSLTPGNYDYSVEVSESSKKITIAKNRQIRTRVKVVEKQT